MCGILAYLTHVEFILQTSEKDEEKSYSEKYELWKTECHDRLSKLKPRGPDKCKYFFLKKIFMGFQRLSIMDLSQYGDQPFTDEKYHASLICNGEIYNYKELIKKYELKVNSGSDCEVILRMYLNFGIEKTLEELDGVFAFVIYDRLRKDFICARDSFGVRPLFLSLSDKGIVASSELKPLYGLDNVSVFPIGSYWSSKTKKIKAFTYVNPDTKQKTLSNATSFISKEHKYNKLSLPELKKCIKTKLTNAITKRLQSDRKIGCLLSGGLDSSLVSSLVKKLGKEKVKEQLVTYSVGLEGSLDLKNARKVANFLVQNIMKLFSLKRRITSN